MTLYEINSQIADAIENGFVTDEETGEVLDGAELLEQLLIDRDTKIEHIGLYIKNARAEADAIRTEEKALAERRKTIESRIDKLEKYVDGTIRSCYPDGFKTSKICYSFTKSKSLFIEDENGFIANPENQKYLNFKPSIDKRLITNLIKNGEEIEGCSLQENKNLKIK